MVVVNSKTEVKSTLTSRVYGYILANQGCTSREIRRGLNLSSEDGVIGPAINSLIKRSAIEGVANTEKERSTRYFKGAAPVVLKQPANGTTQKKISKMAQLVQMQQQLQQSLAEMLAVMQNVDLHQFSNTPKKTVVKKIAAKR